MAILLLVQQQKEKAKALRLCCGTFKMTLVSALQVELGEMPLHIRHKQLTTHYSVHLQGYFEDRDPTTRGTSPDFYVLEEMQVHKGFGNIAVFG